MDNTKLDFFLLDMDNPVAWALMPYAIERVKVFCLKYHTDTDPERMAELIRLNFVADNPLILMAVGYKKGVGVFLHCMVGIEDITGNRFLTIMQYESDLPIPESARGDLMEAYRKIEEWGKQHGAQAVNFVTMDENGLHH